MRKIEFKHTVMYKHFQWNYSTLLIMSMPENIFENCVNILLSNIYKMSVVYTNHFCSKLPSLLSLK